jgi:hypothetical protein
MRNYVRARTRAVRGSLWRVSDVLTSLLLGMILGCGLMSWYYLALDQVSIIATA